MAIEKGNCAQNESCPQLLAIPQVQLQPILFSPLARMILDQLLSIHLWYSPFLGVCPSFSFSDAFLTLEFALVELPPDDGPTSGQVLSSITTGCAAPFAGALPAAIFASVETAAGVS